MLMLDHLCKQTRKQHGKQVLQGAWYLGMAIMMDGITVYL